MIREKQVTIIKIRTKINIKLNSKGWNWKKIFKKYIYSNQKFKDQIWYNQQIIWHF
jgi:hypothetical protein